MTKNTSGGSGHKKRSHSSSVLPVKDINELAKKPENKEVYGKVVRAMGNRRFEVACQMPDNSVKNINCSIRGSFKKLILKDDYVLVQLFDFNDRQAIILTSYTQDDVFKLRRAKLWDYHEDTLEDENQEFSSFIQKKPQVRQKTQPLRGDVQVQKFFSDDDEENEDGEEANKDDQDWLKSDNVPVIPVAASVTKPVTELSSYDIDCI